MCSGGLCYGGEGYVMVCGPAGRLFFFHIIYCREKGETEGELATYGFGGELSLLATPTSWTRVASLSFLRKVKISDKLLRRQSDSVQFTVLVCRFPCTPPCKSSCTIWVFRFIFKLVTVGCGKKGQFTVKL